MTSSVWLRPERTGVGRPPRWTRDEVTRAAVAVADREGIEAVTMRRVGAELGTGAGSLYRYVQSRDELLDLMRSGTVDIVSRVSVRSDYQGFSTDGGTITDGGQLPDGAVAG